RTLEARCYAPPRERQRGSAPSSYMECVPLIWHDVIGLVDAGQSFSFGVIGTERKTLPIRAGESSASLWVGGWRSPSHQRTSKTLTAGSRVAAAPGSAQGSPG